MKIKVGEIPVKRGEIAVDWELGKIIKYKDAVKKKTGTLPNSESILEPVSCTYSVKYRIHRLALFDALGAFPLNLA